MAEIREVYWPEGNVIALDPEGEKLLRIGDHFKATDALGRTFQYQYLGMYTKEYQYLHETIKSEVREFHLFNETWNQFTDVEHEWFNQRKIVILPEADNENENEGENENGTED